MTKPIVYFSHSAFPVVVGKSAVVYGVHSHHTLPDDYLSSYANLITTSKVLRVFYHTEKPVPAFETLNTLYVSRGENDE
jgi:hypothetical protein